MIFFDRSIPKSVPAALDLVRDDIEWLDRLSPGDQPVLDTEWLRWCGDGGWIAITRDRHIGSRPAERQTIEDARVGAFIVRSGKGLNRWEYLRLLAATLDEIERRFAETARPFLYSVSGAGIRRLG